MQNNKPIEEFTSQELINAIERELLETLWMELAYLDKLQFKYDYSTNARGIVFAPFGFESVTEENIEEYFSFDRDFDKWVDLKFDIFYEDVLEELEGGYMYQPFHTQYIFCLEYGQNLNHLTLSSNFNKSQFIANQLEFDEEGFNGVDVTAIPNKEKIKKLLQDRGHMFGDLDDENKEIIIKALIDTLTKPYETANKHILNFEGMSEHLLELIKMHPKTPDELKALILISES